MLWHVLLLPWQCVNINTEFWILLCLRVCQMWCVSFIFVKKLVSLSLYRLQCSKKSCSLSALSHYLPSSFCLYALFSPLPMRSASSFSLSALSPSLPHQFSSVCFIGMNVGWTVLPKHSYLSFLFSTRLPLKINLIWGHLLFRTLTPYGQPPTQSTSTQFHENLKSSHIKYWWSCILTSCQKPCLEFSLLELWIITSDPFQKMLTWTSQLMMHW